MTTDPRIAALAEALAANLYREDMLDGDDKPSTTVLNFDRLAAAILAALPPDWCGHDEIIWQLNADLDHRNEQIARLRKIEEAARLAATVLVSTGPALIRATNQSPNEDARRLNALLEVKATEAYDALRAALEAER